MITDTLAAKNIIFFPAHIIVIILVANPKDCFCHSKTHRGVDWSAMVSIGAVLLLLFLCLLF